MPPGGRGASRGAGSSGATPNRRREVGTQWRAHHSWAASLVLFALVVLLASPPSPSVDSFPGGGPRRPGPIDRTPTLHTAADEAESGTGQAASPVQSAENPSVLVMCTLTTPASGSPSTAASGSLRITVRPDLAPNASSAFLRLIDAGYYDGVYVFRVIRGFVAQFGFRPDWKGDNKIRPKKIAPDPILPNGKSLSNGMLGTIAFAGGNAGSGQVFVNLGNNARLDEEGEGARPFAMLDSESIALLREKLYYRYKGGQGQIPTIKKGREAVAEKFPEMSRIENCRRSVHPG